MVSKSGTSDVEVRVRSAADQPQIPTWLGSRLRLGARSVGRLRRDIALQGGLPTLPPVQIFPEVWRVNGELVLGKVGATKHDGALHLAVVFPAPTVVQSDEELMRSILVVQFYTCISSMARSGAKNSCLSTRLPLVEPSDWFGPNDTARVKSWLGIVSDGLEVIAGLLSKSLPTVAPPPDDKLVNVHVPSWVWAHVALGQDRPSSSRSTKDSLL